ncbi:cytochrome c biogenesis protein ResB [Salinibacillus xinjiangensis]|uniref:Cytochrome C biogenesis protein n=1 Tax=Salinibacillus xinjiangensis TaxID=1229268 RepID=A0A6G1X679_9BACI|nr:cytochrome c biogenesis protein ResB [Salinibacillus xinjiangensis]MRG86447.1 cytochrome C biogenesis protein [Salinibacillus xinjiangensis]
MKNIKCDCGHVNPEGTVLCEACGKPIESNQHIDGNEKNKLLNMRYEGSARRSKTYNRTIVDKIWMFFSSVKVGVWLIILTLIASALGTLFPQEMYIPPAVDPAEHYRDEYGIIGQIYYQLGFHNLYSSWWYMLLVASIGVSLVICSIDRVVPLYRALKKQRPKRNSVFIKRQRYFAKTQDVSKQDVEKVVSQLKKKNYKIREEQGHILAEKGRFSRWGPYVNHIGLIIILIAALLRAHPFFFVEDYVWVREGETKIIPQTDQQYYIKNNDFIFEVYDENDERYGEAIEKTGEMIPSNFQTNAEIFKVKGEPLPGQDPELVKVNEGAIQVNKPLKVNDLAIYQSSYQLNEFQSMSFKLHLRDDENEESLGEFTFNMNDPKSEYDLGNGYRVVVDEYYPEFYMDDGVPDSKSKYPKDPAFIFFVYGPDIEEYEVNFLAVGTNLNPTEDNKYKLSITGVDMRDVTGLTLKRDHTLPLFMIGAIIFMIGVVQGMYWYHRRIWIHPKDGELWIAGHTNKNWYGLKRDLEKVLEDTKVEMPQDQQELK